MNIDLTGKTILLTGATSGIGLDVAHMLVEMGAKPILIGRNKEALDKLSTDLRVECHSLDITDEVSVKHCIGQMEPLDGLVNCAGISVLDEAHAFNAGDLDAMWQTNVRAAASVAREDVLNMQKEKRTGSIVNVSSQAALVALEQHLGYCATKAAMDAMTRVQCLEWGPLGIRVNSVNPTVTLTPMAERVWSAPEKRDPMLAAIPLGRFAKPRDVSLPIGFLLSEAANMISGVSLPIDGGYTAR